MSRPKPVEVNLSALPWSHVEPATMTTATADITAQVAGRNVGCRITIDDPVRSEHMASGDRANSVVPGVVGMSDNVDTAPVRVHAPQHRPPEQPCVTRTKPPAVCSGGRAGLAGVPIHHQYYCPAVRTGC